jgi:hypothetical protein
VTGRRGGVHLPRPPQTCVNCSSSHETAPLFKNKRRQAKCAPVCLALDRGYLSTYRLRPNRRLGRIRLPRRGPPVTRSCEERTGPGRIRTVRTGWYTPVRYTAGGRACPTWGGGRDELAMRAPARRPAGGDG